MMMSFSRYISALIAFFVVGVGAMSAQSLVFEGASSAPVPVSVEMSTGLNGVYVLEDTDGVTASVSGMEEAVRWYRFGVYGAAHAEEIGEAASLRLAADDCGYVVEAGTRRYYFWVVNYSNHRLSLHGLKLAAEQECDRVHLTLEGSAAPIYYYTINGQRRDISRELKLKYNSLEYDANSESYLQKQEISTLASVEGNVNIQTPLCDTHFTLSGDRFLEHWGKSAMAESDFYRTNAVEAHTSATQEDGGADNEQDSGTEGLGGSAPCPVRFSAAVTDAAVFVEWQLSRDPEFEVIDDRYRQLEFDYTFRENGTTYVRFVCDNDAGTCAYVGETYEVQIGESSLRCPNAFSPGASEGVNDEWRVSYKSIIKFECHIFNRWGTQLFSTTDPAIGWDGKHKGKLVPSGAYYYVIKAVGSDGRKYNLSGDINILHSKYTGSASGESPAE